MEVVAPAVLSRMEKRNLILRTWIENRDVVLFAVVAVMAGECKVIQAVAAGCGEGKNVVYCERIQREGLR